MTLMDERMPKNPAHGMLPEADPMARAQLECAERSIRHLESQIEKLEGLVHFLETKILDQQAACELHG